MEDTKHRGVFRCHFFGCAVFIELMLFGHEGGVGGFVVLELGVPKLFASVHVESPCSSTKSITLWSVPSSVAGLRGRRVTFGTNWCVVLAEIPFKREVTSIFTAHFSLCFQRCMQLDHKRCVSSSFRFCLQRCIWVTTRFDPPCKTKQSLFRCCWCCPASGEKDIYRPASDTIS